MGRLSLFEQLQYLNDKNTYTGTDDPTGRSRLMDALVVRIGGNFRFSGRRLMCGIELVSRLDNGLGLFRYR